MMCGGVGEVNAATDEVKAMVSELLGSVNEKTGKNYTDLTALQYTSQVVAGTNFFVKVKANDGSFLHLRIFRPLPHTKENPELHSVLENKSEDDVLGYF